MMRSRIGPRFAARRAYDANRSVRTNSAWCVGSGPQLLFIAGASLVGGAALSLGGRLDRARRLIPRRTSAARAAPSRDRELGAIAAIAGALTRAGDLETAARPLVEQVLELIGVEFAAVAIVDADAKEARGVVARLQDADVDWWRDVRLDLRNEPSGIASAVFDAAPVVVYDMQNSPRVSPRLVERTGARSAVWVPIFAEGRVVGVLTAATTTAKRAFSGDEISLLQVLAGEVALALDRMRSADALARALEREQATAAIARRLRGQHDADEVLRIAEAALRDALHLEHVSAEAGSDGRAQLAYERADPLNEGERLMVETATLEIDSALETSRLLAENRRRIEQQASLLHAAQVVTAELDRGALLQHLVDQAANLLRADAADCYLLDAERSTLRCAAVYGLDGGLVDTEIATDAGAAGLALQRERPVALRAYDENERRLGHPAYRAFADVLAAPMVWGGVVRGVVGVGWRSGTSHSLEPGDVDMLEAFAALASLAVANAEMFADSALARRTALESKNLAVALAERLASVGSTLTAELDPVELHGEVVRQAVGLLAADAGSLSTLEGDDLVVRAVSADGPADAVGRRVPSTGWLGGDVVQLRAPVRRPDAFRALVEGEVDPLLEQGHQAYLGVPLARQEGPVQGVLAVYRKEPREWRPEEVETLAKLAATASTALAYAELHRRLALEHAQSVAILSNVADGIVAVDREGRVVVWNAAAERITGVPAAEALGRSPVDVIHRQLESEAGGVNRFVSIMRGAEEVWLSLSEAVMHDPAGEVAGRIFAFRDISAERAVDQMRSDLVATVSHELRTPLTSIYGFAETLLRRDVAFSDDERELFLGYISSESARLTAIVDALLDVARLERATVEVELVPTDVCVLLNEVVTESTGSPRGNGRRFVLDVDGDVPEVRADPGRLRNAIAQLVESAVERSPAGAVIRLEARNRPGTVEVAVADERNGPVSGTDRVFDRFSRGDEARSEGGLALFVAQGLMAAMGSMIRVRSVEGEGTRFSFTLPVAAPSER
jgi:PAS domain S-box-containing protein